MGRSPLHTAIGIGTWRIIFLISIFFTGISVPVASKQTIMMNGFRGKYGVLGGAYYLDTFVF